jgi:hypothetical protein
MRFFLNDSFGFAIQKNAPKRDKKGPEKGPPRALGFAQELFFSIVNCLIKSFPHELFCFSFGVSE